MSTDYLKLAREAREKALLWSSAHRWPSDVCMKRNYCSDVPALCDAIEAQAATIDALMAQRDAQAKVIESAALAARAGLHDKVAEQAEEIERLRTALRWYASPEAWTFEQVEGSYGDYGQRARAALEGGAQ